MAGERVRGGRGIFWLARFWITCPVPQMEIKTQMLAGERTDVIQRPLNSRSEALSWPCHQLANLLAIQVFMLPVFKGIITPIQIPITTTLGSHHVLFYLTRLIFSEKHLDFLQTISTFRNVTYEEIRQLPFTLTPVIWQVVKNPPASPRNWRRSGFNLWVRKVPWRRKWQPTPVSLPGEFHGHRSLEGYSPCGHKE